MRISIGRRDMSDTSGDGPSAVVWMGDASQEAVNGIVATDPDGIDDCRSQWVWIRFPNGDLFLACAPQGDTYFTWEEEYV